MASLALYRKHRPRAFEELIGQEHVTEPLSQAIRNNRLHHAYLFSGPRGCGKTSSARILARSLNCAKGPTPHPCGACESCVALAPDGPGSVDVIEIDAASHGGVDDARELRERAFFTPVSSRYKVYVIDEAHMVSSAGFNALLKLVEEPPEHVMFVFATTEPEKVLPTIRSRTHHYPFRLIPPGVLRPYLELLCKAEEVAVEPAVFPLVVRAGGGSARDALSVLDQLMAGAGPEGVTYQRAVELLGVTDAALIDEICDAFAAADGAAVFRTVDRVMEAGHDPRRFAADLLERLRDLIVLNQVPDAAGKGLLDVPADQVERMTAQALRLGAAELSRVADIVHDGLTQMRGATAPRLVLELICARALLPGAEDSARATLSRLERLERRLEITGAAGSAPDVAGSDPAAATPRVTGPAVTDPALRGPAAVEKEPKHAARSDSPAPEQLSRPSPPDRPSPSPESSQVIQAPERSGLSEAGRSGAGRPEAGHAVPAELDGAAVRRAWPEILEQTKKRRVVWSMLQNVMPRAVQGDVLVLDLQHGGLLPRFSDNEVIRVIQEALTEVLGVRWNIRCEVAGRTGRPAHAAAPGSGPSSPQGPAVSGHAADSAEQRRGQLDPSGGSSSDHGGDWDSAAGGSPSEVLPEDPEPSRPPLSTYEGFDPDDQPLDPGASSEESFGSVATPEEQAVALLQQTFGAERIT